MDSKQPSGNETRVRRTALVVVLALTAAWSGNALSRTQPIADCDAGTRLQDLNVPVGALVLKTVDHVPTAQDVSDIESIDIEKVTRDTGTPLLNLEPSVNDTIKSVFGDDGTALMEASALDIPVAPIADSEDVPDLSELPDDGTQDSVQEEASVLPLLERRMYRIDI